MRGCTSNYKLNECVSNRSDASLKILDQGYKLLNCAYKMVVYKKTAYTIQNVHVCKMGL